MANVAIHGKLWQNVAIMANYGKSSNDGNV